EVAAELEYAAGVPAPVAVGAAAAEFNWLERAGFDGGEEEAPCGAPAEFEVAAELEYAAGVPAPVAVGAAAAEFNWLERAGFDGGEEEAPCGAPAEFEVAAELEYAAGVPAPAAVGAAAAEFNWLERAGFDGGEEEAPCGFDTTWFARLDEVEPDCHGGVDACWLDTGGLDRARNGTGADADETWPRDTRFVSAGSRASMRK